MIRAALIGLLFLVCGCTSTPGGRSSSGEAFASADGVPVTIDRSRQYDLTSRINGRTYRIMVSVPFKADPDKAYPVLYVLDGNQYFGTASEALTRQSALKNVAPAIVVGIGYPTDDPTEVFKRRAHDLTISPPRDPKMVGEFGGADVFLRVLEEEIKPFVAARYKIAMNQQIIWGQSYAGLTVLRALFRSPARFSTYILSSPSIWWNDEEVLADEPAFANRARSGELRLRVLLTAAGDENPRTVKHVSELSVRLSLLKPTHLTVVQVVFAGEIHNTVPQASLSRALRFALPLQP